MMFMMPMPPTISETAATPASKNSITAPVDDAAAAIDCKLRTWKSSG